MKKTARLHAVLNKPLGAVAAQSHDFIAGSDGMADRADRACCPWVVPHARQRQNLADFPHLATWFQRIGARLDTEAKTLLFGQDAATLH